MTRFLFLAILALTPVLPVMAQAQTPEPVLSAPPLVSQTTSLRDALIRAFDREKVAYIIGPGVDGIVSTGLPTLPLGEIISLLVSAADRPVKVEFKEIKRSPAKNDFYGIWVIKVLPTEPSQINVAPAQVHVTNNMPKNPTIASLNLASTGDPLLAVLELQASLLEQELASAKEQLGSGHEVILAMQSQLATIKRQLVLRRAQATKKTTAAATTKRR